MATVSWLLRSIQTRTDLRESGVLRPPQSGPGIRRWHQQTSEHGRLHTTSVPRPPNPLKSAARYEGLPLLFGFVSMAAGSSPLLMSVSYYLRTVFSELDRVETDVFGTLPNSPWIASHPENPVVKRSGLAGSNSGRLSYRRTHIASLRSYTGPPLVELG